MKRAKLEQASAAPAGTPAVARGAESYYKIGAKLGAGSFSSVWRAEHKATNKAYAVKKVSKSSKVPGAATIAADEIRILKVIGIHRHVAGLVDEFETSTDMCLVLELASGGEVFERVAQNGAFGEAMAAAVVRQLAEGLQHVHARHVIHADIKPENLLYVSTHPDSEVKLADFGLAVFCGGSHPATVKNWRGTISYSAPEMVEAKHWDHAVDLWAVGVLLFVLLGGYMPFDPSNSIHDKKVCDRILRAKPAYTKDSGGYPEQWERVSAAARGVIDKLLEYDPRARLTATGLHREAWVAGGASSEPLPESTRKKLLEFNESRRVWRLAADTIALVTRAPHTAAVAAAASGLSVSSRSSTSFSSTCASSSATAPASSPGTRAPPTGSPGRLPALAASAASAASRVIRWFSPAAAPQTAQAFSDLPAQAKKELRAAFDRFDADGDGQISLGELHKTMRTLGTSDADAGEMLKSLDEDRDGSLSFDEFARKVAPLYQESSTALRRAFDFFDSDGSGTIEKRELEVVLTRLGVASKGGRMQKEVLDKVFTVADTNQDGKVSFDEFLALFAHEAVVEQSSRQVSAVVA
jgi:serine/threonine protein kinase